MFFRFSFWLITAVLLSASLGGEEQNIWPLSVKQMRPDGSVESAEYLGPLFFDHVFFEHDEKDQIHQTGFRPLYMKRRIGGVESDYLLYPFFTWRKEDGYSSFSFFAMINERQENYTGKKPVHAFDFWPIYFHHETGDPESSYRALFPIGGTIKQFFQKDRISFVLFPLYTETEYKGLKTTYAPWPLIRYIHGAGAKGFEFWPLFGHQGRPADYDSQFYLWPLIYKNAKNLAEPQPDVKLGVLPLYARATGPGYIDESFAWPFFGYTHRTAPVKYDEHRYLWPFLVQGRGDVSYVNRWGPIYTHSIIKGYDKTWFPWPIFRHAQWEDHGLIQEKNQVFYFLYWSLTQRSSTNPGASSAHKTHLWPLLSSWDNGAGSRQLQLLSPFEVFFPINKPVRYLYSPLFTVYRYDQRAPDDTSHSLLFSLLSWKKSPVENEFHFGPLFSTRSTPQGSRVTFISGLLAWQRPAGTHRWKFSLFDFHPNPDNKTPEAKTS